MLGNRGEKIKSSIISIEVKRKVCVCVVGECVQDKESCKMSAFLSYVSIIQVRSVNLTLVMFAGKMATNHHPGRKYGNNKKN